MFASHPNRALLNPKFESYKLDALEESEHVFRYPLEVGHRPRQAAVSGRTPLSFHEVQSRIRHNHLSVSFDGRRAVYVDGDLQVMLVEFGNSLEPTYRAIYELTMPVFTEGIERPQKEYASVAFIDENILVAADGYGALYLLDLSSVPNAQSSLRGIYELPSESNSTQPFQIHLAIKAKNDVVLLILSSSARQFDGDASTTSTPPPSNTAPKVHFDIFCVEISLSSDVSRRALQVKWRLQGQDAPLFVAYELAENAVLLAGSARYKSTSGHDASFEEYSTHAAAPIPQAGEDLDAPSNESQPPPYAWTQDNEEVTIAIPLAASTASNTISVNFSPQTLSLNVRGTSLAPHYSAARLWGGIAPSASFWTWDAAGSARFGLLTLHLEKQHSGTRWPSVFDAAAGQPEVPETLDPSALAEIRETMEKFTAAAAGAGEVGAVPSITEGERDDEVDTAVGNEICLTWAAAVDGCAPKWAMRDMDASLVVLSTPLPGTAGVSLIAKHTIDGLLFEHSTREASEWTHVGTYPALAFVLASKRDTRFVHHVTGVGVLAFEGGTGTGGGNVYIYRNAPREAKHAKQAILRIGGGSAGALLGIGTVKDGDRFAVACLCENEIVMLRGVL